MTSPNESESIKYASSSSESDPHDTITIDIHNDDHNECIPNNNIQGEIYLETYTEQHFNNLTSQDLGKIRNIQNYQPESDEYNTYRSISPVISISGSNYGSGSGSGSDRGSEDNTHFMDQHVRVPTTVTKYKKFNTNDIEKYITKYYPDRFSHTNSSNKLDILTTFVKGQKSLYTLSRNITQQKLNCLFFPALLISTLIAMVSPMITCGSWNTNIISGLNALLALFIALINYFKLESTGEMYTLLATLFDNMETSLELANSKLLVVDDPNDVSNFILTKFNEVENKISDYKLTNPVLIPEEIKKLFPVICHANIFSFIKKTETHQKELIEKLKNVKNEIQYIHYQWAKQDRIKLRTEKLKNNSEFKMIDTGIFIRNGQQTRINELHDIKEHLRKEIVEFQSTYTIVENIFTKEIYTAEQNQNKWWFCILCFFWKKNTNIDDYFYDINPALSSFISQLHPSLY